MISLGGTISLKETSDAFLNVSKIANIKALKGGVLNADFNSQVKIYNSYFENCESDFGAIIFLSNGFKSILTIEMSHFFNNSANESLFYLQDSMTYIKNSDFNFSGNLIATYATRIIVQNLKFENSICIKERDGCLFSFNDDSISYISEVFIENTNENLIFIYMSTLYGNNSKIQNIKGNSESLFLYSEYSDIDLKNFTFINFENSLILMKKKNLNISESYFNNKQYGNMLSNSLIFCLFCEQIRIKNTNFFHISSITNGSCIYIFQCTEFLIIFNSTFTNNTSNNSGGVLFMEDSYGSIENCSFLNNQAIRGGALLVMCSNLGCYINLLYNLFNENYASFEGGVLKWYYSPPRNLSTNVFKNNTAKIYGNNLASRPVEFNVNIYEQNDSSKIVMNSRENITEFQKGFRIIDQKSGNPINKLEFFLLDMENQIFITLSKIMMKVELIKFPIIFSNNNAFLKELIDNTTENVSNYAFFYGTSNILMNENNSFVFDKINVAGTPNTTIFLKFYLPSMNYLTYHLYSLFLY